MQMMQFYNMNELLFFLLLVLIGYLGRHVIKAECTDVCQHPDAQCINSKCLCSGVDYDTNTCLPSVSTCNIHTESAHIAKAYIEGHRQSVYSCQAQILPFSNRTLDSVHILSTHNLPTHNTTKELVLTASVTLNFDETYEGEIILALACYDDILWELYVHGNVRQRIDRVILLSSNNCGVRSVPESAINQIEVLPKRVPKIPFGYGNDTMAGMRTPALIRLVEQTYGPVTSFYGSLSADHWIVNINKASMSQEPENPRTPNNDGNLQASSPPPPTPPPPFPIRLYGGSEPHTGFLEIFHDNIWGSVCGNGWNDLDSYVACRQLGYKGGIEFTSLDIKNPGKGNEISLLGKIDRAEGQILLSDVRCDGTEVGLHQCKHGPFGEHSCFYWESVNLRCAETEEDAHINIRLTSCDQSSEKDSLFFDAVPLTAPCHSGVVEVLYHGRWNKICDNTLHLDTATAICRELGYKEALGATPGGLLSLPNEGFVRVRVDGSSHAEKLAVVNDVECSSGGLRVICSSPVLAGKNLNKLVETEPSDDAAFDLALFFIILFLMFITACVLIICIFYMCRSKNKVIKISQSPHPFLRRVMDKSALFLVNTKKEDETPILDVASMATLQTLPGQWDLIETQTDVTKITNYNDLVKVTTRKV